MRFEAGPGSKARRCALAWTLLVAGCLLGHSVQAEEDSAQATSPWLLIPTFSNNPKLGSAVGGMGAYLKQFDPASQASIFAVSAQYTSTNSATVALLARTSFAADHQRLLVFALGGMIKNDYDDFLGTGVPLKSEDHIRAFTIRYLYRVKDDWFIGAQALSTNYQIVGQTPQDEDVVGLLGLTGFESAGAGLVLYHDSRDRTDSPSDGWVFNLNNVAYQADSEATGSFDVYRLDYRQYWSHGDGDVFAVRQSNQWTQDAPSGALSTVRLRGYTSGEYLGKSMSSIEAEERYRFAERWTGTLFAGAACLYGANRGGCSDSANIYPSVGGGVQYVLKPVQGIVANLELAVGKDGNRALLFQLGYGF